jgi:ankyrin repeat protein
VTSIEDFLRASVRGPLMKAGRLLAEDPAVATDLRAAVVLGDVDRLRVEFAGDPDLATRTDPTFGWTALLAVCSSRWCRDPARAAGLFAEAELLLDAGADPNERLAQPYCAPLYAAAGLTGNEQITRLLLARGADPDTPSALYHAAFHEDTACLQLLLDHGARAEGSDALGAALSVDNTGAVRALLAAGVDPRVDVPAEALGQESPAQPPLYTAVATRCAVEIVELLLAAGADPAATGPDGRSAYQLAVRQGQADLVDRIPPAGPIEPVDELLGACLRADGPAARAVVAANPGLVERLDPADLAAIVDAAEHVGAGAVGLMLELGFPVGTLRPGDGATALHAAAYHERADLVRLLLAAGADTTVRDSTFDSDPMGWALEGSGEGRTGGDPVGTVAALLDAGAVADGWSADRTLRDDVVALLDSRGVPR